MRITLETVNAIFWTAYPFGKGFEHNSGNDAIIESLNAMSVTEDDVREYTTTDEFKLHERGYHALRGLHKAMKAKYRPSKAPRAPRAPKAPKAPAEPAPMPTPAEPTPAPKAPAEMPPHFQRCVNVLSIAARPLLMTGPAGSGKSYTAEKVAETVGASAFFTQSKVSFDTDLKGYMDAYGNYIPTALYRAIKRADGGEKTAYFLDEIFAGDTSCLTVINDLLSDGRMTFPNGETLSAANLIIMAADNTNGNGATNQYNTRNKADKSFLNRFGCVFVDYDRKVEKTLSRGHDDILEFVRAIRAASERNEMDIVVSYRSIDAMAKYADAGIDPAESVNAFVYQDALTDDDKDTLRQDAKIAKLIAKGNVYACVM